MIAESRPQSVQHSAEPKVQIHKGVISNDQRREKAEVRRRASLKVGSPGPASPWPESIQEEGERRGHSPHRGGC